MKQVININFQGQVVPIEVTAFDLLKVYIESLNRHFALEEGKEEIINDIESRIGELFQDRLKKGSTCITDEDVNAIIRSMGRPEDLESAEASPLGAQDVRDAAEAAGTFNTGATKRLYRDENFKIIGGVCSGLANYFNIDVVVVRIIFVVLGISFGFGLISYLVLWIAVPSSATLVVGGLRKRLFRDHDEKIIAGVCSGIANYFGVNAWIPRVLFLLPFLGFISRWGNWDDSFNEALSFGFSPGALIIYVILWLVIPEAFSTSEKLEMKGEKVDMNSIKNSVMEEMKGVQQRAEKFTREARSVAQERGKNLSGDVSSLARRGGRSLGDIIALLVKIFVYFVLGCLGLFFIIGLFSLAIVAIGLFPLKDFVLNDGWQNVFAWGTLIFFIAVPIVGVITWIVRRIAKIRSNRKPMRFTFIALWIVGWFSFISLIASVSRDFRAINELREQEITLTNPAVNGLEITNNSPSQRFYQGRRFRFEPFSGLYEDSAILENVRIHIAKSPNDSFRVTMFRVAHGRSRRSADTLASMINFNVKQVDSLLVIDRGFEINRKDKFRNQSVIITVYVPVGKQIKVNRNVGWRDNIHFGPWGDNDWDTDFGELEHGWDHNETYTMRADGLYTLSGEAADEWKHKDRNDDDNFDPKQIPDTSRAGQYRYEQRNQNDTNTKQPTRQQSIENSSRDSLLREKAIEQKIERTGARVNAADSDQVVTYSLPGYNPTHLMR